VYVPLVACVVGAACAPLVARRAEPRIAATVLVVTGLMLAVASAAALALLAFASAARIPAVAARGHWAAESVASREPVPTWLGVLAAVSLVAIATNALRVLVSHSRPLSEAVRLQLRNAGDIITVNDQAAYAYACRALPFRPGVIIVSDGLHRSLDREQRAAVLAHEQSHLEHHHHLYEMGAMLTSALNPLLRPIERHIRFCLERWADEDAAAARGRETAASALAVSALQRSTTTPLPQLAHATNAVPARVRALLDDPHPRGRFWVGSATLNALLATAAAVLAAHSTELIFEALRRLK
jgi:hypothetical protein